MYCEEITTDPKQNDKDFQSKQVTTLLNLGSSQLPTKKPDKRVPVLLGGSREAVGEGKMNPVHSKPLVLPAPDYAGPRGTEQDLKEKAFHFLFFVKLRPLVLSDNLLQVVCSSTFLYYPLCFE